MYGSKGTTLLMHNLDARWRREVTSRAGRVTPGKENQYPPNRTMGGLQSQSGRFGKKTNL
jgi:hypothetical protein